MISIHIDIKCDDRQKAREMIEEIAANINNGAFAANCTKENQEYYGGTVFVLDDD
jgi:hypothetical protein